MQLASSNDEGPRNSELWQDQWVVASAIVSEFGQNLCPIRMRSPPEVEMATTCLRKSEGGESHGGGRERRGRKKGKREIGGSWGERGKRKRGRWRREKEGWEGGGVCEREEGGRGERK